MFILWILFYEIPSLPFQDIENQNVADGQMNGLTTWKQYTPPHPHKHSIKTQLNPNEFINPVYKVQ